ncbi:MAG: Gfo/Idh/MocA family oxidoreductase [Planctomycetes bacterium]|nr:Gfo/Idh/MocA family oxidoreductase [Planctomycetota bacterium]
MKRAQISRRRLLGACIAGGVAPLVLPRRLLAGGGLPPSERIQLAIIGLKKMGGAHVSTLVRSQQCRIVAVCDVDRNARDAAQKVVDRAYGQAAGTCPAFNEYERVLERRDVDAVLVAVPDHWHALITIAACEAGKDVYCEKPLSLTIAEGRAMTRAARRHARIVQTGTQQRSSREFRHACELIRNGLIGEIKSVHVEVGPPSQDECLAPQPTPDWLDYDRWLGPAPWAPYNETRIGSNFFNGWRRLRDYSGGKMTDWGAHHFDIVQWALGMDESGPVEIIPPLARPQTRPVPKIIDGTGASPDEPSWGLRYRYAGGVEVVKDGTNGIRFVGSEGEIEVNRGFLRTTPEHLKNYRFRPNQMRLAASDNHHQNWFDSVRSRRRPISDVEIGHRSASVCHLGNIALWLNRPLRWDPAAEQFMGDETANRWLARSRRAGFELPAG